MGKRIYNDNSDSRNDNASDSIENSNVENDGKKIIILVKKMINKNFKFKEIANINVLLYMMD